MYFVDDSPENVQRVHTDKADGYVCPESVLVNDHFGDEVNEESQVI